MEQVIESLDELRARVADADAVMVYFSEPTCQVGTAVEGKLLSLVRDEYPKLDVLFVDVQRVPEAAGQFEVLTVPTVVLCFAGRESTRFVRTFGMDEIRRAIDRPYGLIFPAP